MMYDSNFNDTNLDTCSLRAPNVFDIPQSSQEAVLTFTL